MNTDKGTDEGHPMGNMRLGLARQIVMRAKLVSISDGEWD